MKRMAMWFFILILASLAQPVFAATGSSASSLRVVDVSLTSCAGPLISGNLRVLAYDSSGELVNGTTPITTTVSAQHSNGAAAPVSWDFVASELYQFAFSVGSANVTSVTLVITATSEGISTPAVTVNCDGSVTYAGARAADARLNPNQCDLTSALYATGRGIEVWDVQADSTGLYMGAYTADDVAAYADAPPAANTLIAKSLGKTTLEVLTTGELQIKIAPDAEGKGCTVILDAIAPKVVYFAQ